MGPQDGNPDQAPEQRADNRPNRVRSIHPAHEVTGILLAGRGRRDRQREARAPQTGRRKQRHRGPNEVQRHSNPDTLLRIAHHVHRGVLGICDVHRRRPVAVLAADVREVLDVRHRRSARAQITGHVAADAAQVEVLVLRPDGRVRLPIFDVNLVRPIGVRLSTTRGRRNVGLHQGSIPFTDRGIYAVPLSEVAGIRSADHATNHQAEDDAVVGVVEDGRDRAGGDADDDAAEQANECLLAERSAAFRSQLAASATAEGRGVE